jgi:hypothetical protein
MEENKIKIKFEFTNEFGSTYVQESSFDSMPEYESDIMKMGKLFNIFLKQIGYHRKNDYMLMSSLSEDELDDVELFLSTYRDSSVGVWPYELLTVDLVKSESGDWQALYVNEKLKGELHSISCHDLMAMIGEETNITWFEHTVPDEVAEALPKNFDDLGLEREY